MTKGAHRYFFIDWLSTLANTCHDYMDLSVYFLNISKSIRGIFEELLEKKSLNTFFEFFLNNLEYLPRFRLSS